MWNDEALTIAFNTNKMQKCTPQSYQSDRWLQPGNGGVVSPSECTELSAVAAASPWRYYILYSGRPKINMAFRGPPQVSKAPTIPLFSAAGVRFVYVHRYTAIIILYTYAHNNIYLYTYTYGYIHTYKTRICSYIMQLEVNVPV